MSNWQVYVQIKLLQIKYVKGQRITNDGMGKRETVEGSIKLVLVI
jgi:hypothetical protein